MERLVSPDVASLVDWVRVSKDSSFYRKVWGSETDFTKLPPVSRADLLSTPLSQRSYKKEKGLVKVVKTDKSFFASEWSFEDIAKEDWGTLGLRPLVYFTDPDEQVEKGLWCYEHNRLPLVAEGMPEIVMSAAAFYQIDSLLTDAASLANLLPYLSSRSKPLETISIFGSSFDLVSLTAFSTYAKKIELFLSLPETGAFARAILTADPVFTLLHGCYIENQDGPLLTKTATLVTPIIRYRLSNEVPVQFV